MEMLVISMSNERAEWLKRNFASEAVDLWASCGLESFLTGDYMAVNIALDMKMIANMDKEQRDAFHDVLAKAMPIGGFVLHIQGT